MQPGKCLFAIYPFTSTSAEFYFQGRRRSIQREKGEKGEVASGDSSRQGRRKGGRGARRKEGGV